MERCPIKPGTAVHLPHRSEPAAAKKQPHRKRLLTPEEQMVQLRRSVRRLIAALAVLSLVLCLAVGMLIHDYTQEQKAPVVGRNYTIDTSQQP